MIQISISPSVLAGGGALVLFGVALNEYAKRHVENTGFHARDPDPTLRKTEKDILIPKIMRDRSRLVVCKAEVDAFKDCCKLYPSWRELTTFYTCRAEKKIMMNCMNDRFVDYAFYEECKEIYLDGKHLFHVTGLGKKPREKIKELIVTGEAPPIDIMTPEAKEYYSRVKSMYEETNDIDRYDETLTASRKR